MGMDEGWVTSKQNKKIIKSYELSQNNKILFLPTIMSYQYILLLTMSHGLSGLCVDFRRVLMMCNDMCKETGTVLCVVM